MPKTLDTNKRLTRLMILDETLNNARANNTHLSIKELCKKTGSNRSALNRDLGIIKAIMGNDLVYTTEKVFIDNQYRNVTYYTYSQDAPSIFTNKVSSEVLKNSLSSTLSKLLGLKNSTVTNIFIKLPINEGIISYTVNPAENKISARFSEILSYINDHKNISLKLKSRTDESHYTIQISPWFLREYNRRWHLIGYDLEAKKVKHFALDIIKKISTSENGQWETPKTSINNIYRDIIGISLPDSETYDIIFWADRSQTDYLDTKPLHKSQKQIKEAEAGKYANLINKENGKFYRIHCKLNYELIRDLMSYHENLIVLSPKEIVDKIKDRVKALAEAYFNT